LDSEKRGCRAYDRGPGQNKAIYLRNHYSAKTTGWGRLKKKKESWYGGERLLGRGKKTKKEHNWNWLKKKLMPFWSGLYRIQNDEGIGGGEMIFFR